jgi:hypothetical protein
MKPSAMTEAEYRDALRILIWALSGQEPDEETVETARRDHRLLRLLAGARLLS